MDYFFKVIASEDWKGLREDFKMYSEVVGYKLEYTPKFSRAVQVKERRKGDGGVKTREQEREEKRKQLLEARRRQQERRRLMEQERV